jgi:hypothetical protein
MFRVKMAAIFAAMVAVLALSAVPAFAIFKSTNSKATGAGKSGPVVLEGGGATLECTSAEGTGEIQNAEGKAATEGPTLLLKTATWNGCKAKSSGIKEAKPKVKACTLALKQAAGETKAKGSVLTECTVETTVLFLTCKISVPAENGTENVNLMTNTLENSGGNLIVKAADEGVTTKPKGTCPGIAETHTGKQKAEITGEGVNAS